MRKKLGVFGFRPGDAAVIAAVLIGAVLLFCLLLPSDAPGSVSIVWDGGKAVLPLDRSGSRTVFSAGYAVTVTVENGTVRVSENDCPGGDCMRTGAISRAGQSIVCMPGRVVVKIIGEETADADWILP